MNKKLKKAVSLILALVIFAVPVTASAAETEKLPVMGDVTGDGKVNAADARIILRISASLEPKEGVDLLSADTDGNGRITAADARQTLRVAASLSYFSIGFDVNGAPNALNLINRKTFVMSAEIGDSYEKASVTIAVNGSDVCLLYDDDAAVSIGADGMEDIGIVVTGGKTYIICTVNGIKIAMYVPDEMLGEMLGDEMSVNEITDMIFATFPSQVGQPQKVTVNGETHYAYDYTSYGERFTLYTDGYGALEKIESAYSGEAAFVINSVSYDGINSYFDLSEYAMV